MLESAKKQEIIGSYKVHEKDTGSAFVQIALLTERIMSFPSILKSTRKIITPARAC